MVRSLRLPYKEATVFCQMTVYTIILTPSFFASVPNQKWLTNFKYIWMAEGWLYVAVVLNLYSRRAVGWSMHATMTAQLVTDALMMAVCDVASPTRYCITRFVAAHTPVSSFSAC